MKWWLLLVTSSIAFADTDCSRIINELARFHKTIAEQNASNLKQLLKRDFDDKLQQLSAKANIPVAELRQVIENVDVTESPVESAKPSALPLDESLLVPALKTGSYHTRHFPDAFQTWPRNGSLQLGPPLTIHVHDLMGSAPVALPDGRIAVAGSLKLYVFSIRPDSTTGKPSLVERHYHVDSNYVPSVTADGTFLIMSERDSLVSARTDNFPLFKRLNLGVVLGAPAIFPDNKVIVSGIDSSIHLVQMAPDGSFVPLETIRIPEKYSLMTPSAAYPVLLSNNRFALRAPPHNYALFRATSLGELEQLGMVHVGDVAQVPTPLSDGRLVLFDERKSELMLVDPNADSLAVTGRTRVDRVRSVIEVSPNRILAVTRMERWSLILYDVLPAGGFVKVSETPSDGLSPVLLPNGQVAVFTSGSSEILTIEANGEIKKMTGVGPTNFWEATVLSDGRVALGGGHEFYVYPAVEKEPSKSLWKGLFGRK